MKRLPELAQLAFAGLAFGCTVAVAVPQTVSNASFSVAYDDGTSFGSLSLTGNAISFDFSNPAAPAPWIAQSVDGVGPAVKSDVVTLTLTIDNAAWANGYRFGAVTWIEGGDYERKEAGSTVGVSGSLSAVNTALVNTTTAANLAVLGSGFSTVGANTNWFATAQLDSTTTCTGAGCANVFNSDAQQIQLTVSNALTAQSAAFVGSDAFIEKKLGAGQFTLLVTQVPEASTWTMLLAGLAAVGFVARRRSV